MEENIFEDYTDDDLNIELTRTYWDKDYHYQMILQANNLIRDIEEEQKRRLDLLNNK